MVVPETLHVNHIGRRPPTAFTGRCSPVFRSADAPPGSYNRADGRGAKDAESCHRRPLNVRGEASERQHSNRRPPLDVDASRTPDLHLYAISGFGPASNSVHTEEVTGSSPVSPMQLMGPDSNIGPGPLA